MIRGNEGRSAAVILGGEAGCWAGWAPHRSNRRALRVSRASASDEVNRKGPALCSGCEEGGVNFEKEPASELLAGASATRRWGREEDAALRHGT